MIRRGASFRPNPTIYESGGQLRYAKLREGEGDSWSYELSAVDATPALREALQFAGGGITLDELAVALEATDVPLDVALSFADELVEAQLLIPDLGGSVTGEDRLERLYDRVVALDPNSEWERRLSQIVDALDRLNHNPPGKCVEAYDSILAAVTGLPGTKRLSTCVDVQVHYSMTSAVVGTPTRDRIVEALEVLAILRHQPPDSPVARLQRELLQFRDAFRRRFDDAAVPLGQALDPEDGVGFGGAWGPPVIANEPADSWGPFEDFFFKRIMESMKSGWAPIDVTGSDLSDLQSPRQGQLANAYGALVRIVLGGNPDEKARVAIGGVAGPNAAMLLGRFCHGDANLTQVARDIAEWTFGNTPDAVQAEIVYEPPGRGANVIARPVLSDVEITLVGHRKDAGPHQLKIDELTVFVQDGRIVLYSPCLEREVLPRLTSAHSAFQSQHIPVYRFLYAMQLQGLACYLTWSWRGLRHLPRLPRVIYNGIALSRARWEIPAAAFENALANPAAIHDVRQRHGLPPVAALSKGEDEVIVDFGNPEQFRALRNTLRQGRRLTFYEIYPYDAILKSRPGNTSRGESCIKDGVPTDRDTQRGRQRRAIELAVPVRCSQASIDRQTTRQPRSAPVAVPPGAGCWFAKIYCGYTTADRLLLCLVSPLIAQLAESGLVERWFFVRYADPDHHLRVRVFSSDLDLHGEATRLLHSLLAKNVANGSVAAVQLDTYRPELDRYGGEYGIAVAERLFHADSRAVMLLLDMPVPPSDRDRFFDAVLGVHTLLSDFCLPTSDRVDLLRKMRNMGAASLNLFGDRVGSKEARAGLAARFRRDRTKLRGLIINEVNDEGTAYQASWPGVRSLEVRTIAKELRKLYAQGHLSRSPEVLLESFVHMHLNRLLRSDNRLREYEIYDLMAQTYAGEIARGRRG